MKLGGELVIRADADAVIGTGHVMRCLALGQAWQDAGGQVIFITATQSTGLLQRLGAEGFQVWRLRQSYPASEDWELTRGILQTYPQACMVLDGYHFDESYQRQVKAAGHRLLVIDDWVRLPHYYADILLNQNLYAEGLSYPCQPQTRLLLGSRYVLLRREFLKWRGWQRQIPAMARKVLVTLGGSDVNNVTLKVIQALQELEVEDLEAVVVAGAANPHYQELETATRHLPFSARLQSNVTNMPELMAWADVAIAAAGTTVWELAFMGVPSLLFDVVSHQRPIAEGLGSIGAAVNGGAGADIRLQELAAMLGQLLEDKKRRMRIAKTGQRLIDGRGVLRVLMHLSYGDLRLRKVREGDCQMLWEWANDPTVRAASFSSEPIPWEVHALWFQSQLENPDCLFYIALDGQGRPIGQVRFEIDQSGLEAEISVSIERSKRGLGCGAGIIDLAVMEVFRTTAVEVVHAFVKPENAGSLKTFARADFMRLGMENVKGSLAIHCIRLKDYQKMRYDRDPVGSWTIIDTTP